MKTRLSNATARGLTAAVLNREFKPSEDGWIQLYPFGEFPGQAFVPGKDPLPIVQILDRAAAEAHMKAFRPGTLIDYEHFSHDPEKETRAAGWIEELQIRADGLYARNRWSTSGKDAIEGGDYRFISPEFEQLEDLGDNRYRPLALTGAGLTNRPALKTIKPITNRDSEPTNKPKPQSKMLEKLKKLLGLADDATEDAILDAVSALRDKSTEAEAAIEERDELLEDLAEADIEQFSDVIDDEEKEETKKMLIQNREGTRKLLAAAQSKLAKTRDAEPGHKRVFNRATAKAPGNVIEKENKQHDLRAAKVRNRAHEIARTEKVSFSVAWDRAEAETPDA